MATGKLTLLVMAAGVGSRYGGLKQLDAVGVKGEGIIDYSVYDAARAGFDTVVFIIRKDFQDDFRRIIGAKHESRVRVLYAHQELDDLPDARKPPAGRAKPWGTGQAILAARDLTETPFAVINGDDFYGRDAYRTLAEHLRAVDPASKRYAMVGYRLRNTLSDHGTVSRGVCAVDAQGYLREVVERLKVERRGAAAVSHEEGGGTLPLTGDEIVSMNMFGFTPTIFDLLRDRFRSFLDRNGSDLKSEFLLPNEVNQMVSDGAATLRVLDSTATWFGITYREDRDHVVRSIRALVEAGEYPESLA